MKCKYCGADISLGGHTCNIIHTQQNVHNQNLHPQQKLPSNIVIEEKPYYINEILSKLDKIETMLNKIVSNKK